MKSRDIRGVVMSDTARGVSAGGKDELTVVVEVKDPAGRWADIVGITVERNEDGTFKLEVRRYD